MSRILSLLLMTLVAVTALAQGEITYWNDGKPEVSIGIYFDPAGTVTSMKAEQDTLTAYIIMKNNNLRGEGACIAMEYRLELPENLVLTRDELPPYSHICLGTLMDGFSQTIEASEKSTILLNTLHLLRTGELGDDATLSIVEHPKTGKMQYVSRVNPNAQSVGQHMVVGGEAVLNPRLANALEGLRPVRSR